MLKILAYNDLTFVICSSISIQLWFADWQGHWRIHCEEIPLLCKHHRLDLCDPTQHKSVIWWGLLMQSRDVVNRVCVCVCVCVLNQLIYVAVKKYHDQKQFINESIYLNLESQRDKSPRWKKGMAASRVITFQLPRGHTENRHQVWQSYEFPKPIPRDVLAPSRPHILRVSRPPQTVPTTGNQVFRYVHLCMHWSFHHTHTYNTKLTVCVLWFHLSLNYNNNINLQNK